MSDRERRKAERVPFKVSATVEIQDRRIVADSTEDLSTKGVLIRCGEQIETGTPCRVLVELSGSSSRLQLEMEGRVARSVEGHGMAIEFTSVDLDCFTYLKQIVQHNLATEDPQTQAESTFPESV